MPDDGTSDARTGMQKPDCLDRSAPAEILKLRLSRWRETSLAFYWISILNRSVSKALSRRQSIVVSFFLVYASGHERVQRRDFKGRNQANHDIWIKSDDYTGR